MALSANALFSGNIFGSGNKLWHYTSSDAQSAIVGAGYFNDAANLLKVGDIIAARSTATVSGTTGGGLQVYHVTANAAGAVTIVAAL